MTEFQKWIQQQNQQWENKYGHCTIEELESLYVLPDDLDHYFNCWLNEKIAEKRKFTTS